MPFLPSGTISFLFTDIEGKYCALGADNSVSHASVILRRS